MSILPTRLEPEYHRSHDTEPHFWDYWMVVVRHRRTVLLVLAGAVLTAFIWSVTARPVYTGSALIRIEREEPRVLKFEAPGRDDNPGDSGQTQLQTYHRLLQSRALANRVIALAHLERYSEFRPAGRRPGEVTDAFLERLRVESVRNTRLIKVSFDSRNPEVAAQVPNSLAEAAIAQQLDDKQNASRYATRFLTTQVDEARRALQAKEAQLNQFMQDNDILFVGADRIGGQVVDRQSLVGQELATLSDSLLKAKSERIAKESMLAQATGPTAENLPAVLQNPLVANLKEEATKLEGRYRELGQSFKPEYPRMQRLEENIKEVRRQLRAEIQRFADSVRKEYLAALQNETEIRKLVDQQRGMAKRLDGEMAQYNLLRREADTSRDLYTALSTRLKETRVSSALVLSNISLVDRAEVPFKRSGPRTALNLLIGCLVGLVGGVGLAFLFEYLDTSIRDPREVEALLRVPTLGLLPTRSALPAHLDGRRLGAGDGPRGAQGAFALVSHQATSSILAEAFRNLRTSVVYATPDRPPKTMLVTSLQQQDGKTSISTNCAITLAQLGLGDVLLVDADLRHPDLHRILDVPQTPGLSDLLVGGVPVADVIRPTRIPGLYVIPAGPVPTNPAELLFSPRFTELLVTAGQRFVHVVIDSPPMLGVTDTLVLAPRVEGVILVLRHRQTGRDAAQRAVQMLGSVRARLLGVVLNHADVRSTSAAYQYYHQEPIPSGPSLWSDWTTRGRSTSRDPGSDRDPDVGAL
ncbi:MAG TPA: polysaccharide biosynthesis tyrosine autokinase [Methylomirabilota bacterium]|nr:polysaccharide biosynthesis tyrosine autokinase [Methylomirabilota bacterium]